MSTITKERLEPVIERLEHYATNVKWTNVQAAQDMLIAVDAMRIALASLEAEPVAYMHRSGQVVTREECCDDKTFAICCKVETPLYTAPPAPVSVPDEKVKGDDFELDGPLSCYQAGKIDGWNEYRAAMLQGAEKAEPLHAVKAAPLLNYSVKGIELQHANFQTKADGNYPDGWVACSELMPELDTRVLLYFPDYGGHIEDGCIGDEGEGHYHYFFDGDSLRHEPTHWMPMPAAPRQDVKP